MTMLNVDAREQMIEQQVRAWDVLDGRVLALLRKVPREHFVPAAQRVRGVAARLLEAQRPVPVPVIGVHVDQLIGARVVEHHVAELVEDDDAVVGRPDQPFEELRYGRARRPGLFAAASGPGEEVADHRTGHQCPDGQCEGNRRGQRPIVS